MFQLHKNDNYSLNIIKWTHIEASQKFHLLPSTPTLANYKIPSSYNFSYTLSHKFELKMFKIIGGE